MGNKRKSRKWLLSRQDGGSRLQGGRGSGWAGACGGLGRCRPPLSPLGVPGVCNVGMQFYFMHLSYVCQNAHCMVLKRSKTMARVHSPFWEAGNRRRTRERGRGQKGGTEAAVGPGPEKRTPEAEWLGRDSENAQPQCWLLTKRAILVMQDPLLPLPQIFWKVGTAFCWNGIGQGESEKAWHRTKTEATSVGPELEGEGTMSTELNSVCVFSEGTQPRTRIKWPDALPFSCDPVQAQCRQGLSLLYLPGKEKRTWTLKSQTQNQTSFWHLPDEWPWASFLISLGLGLSMERGW